MHFEYEFSACWKPLSVQEDEVWLFFFFFFFAIKKHLIAKIPSGALLILLQH